MLPHILHLDLKFDYLPSAFEGSFASDALDVGVGGSTGLANPPIPSRSFRL